MNNSFPTAGTILTLLFLFWAAGASGQEIRVSDTVRWEQGGLKLSDMKPVYNDKGATYRVYPVPDSIVIPVQWSTKTDFITDTIRLRRGRSDYDYYRFLMEQERDPIIEIDFRVGYDKIYGQEGNLKYAEKRSFSYILRSQTKYDINRCDSWCLRYNQVQFDIFEGYRRWQEELISSGQKSLARSSYFSNLQEAALRTFRMESSYGRDTAVVKQYEQRYAAMLDTLLPNPVYVPSTDHDNHGLCLTLGAFYEHFVDGVPGELITTPGLFVGLGYSYRNLCLQLELGGLAVGHVPERDFWHDPKQDYDWIQYGSTRAGRVSANLGYKVIDRPYFTLTPYVGIGIMSISQKTNILDSDVNNGFRYSDLNGSRVQAGLNLDWKIVRNLNTGYLDNYYEQKVSLRLYGARMQFADIGPAYSVFIGVAYQFEKWNI